MKKEEMVQLRHARWERTEVTRNGETHVLYVCSNCGDYHGFKAYDSDPGYSTFASNYLYCRRCGARMDEGEEQ